MSLFAELKRRNVLRASVLYVGAVWALAQGIAQLAPLFGDFDWIARWFVMAGVIGFPFWIAFAWFYEITPGGLKRESEIDPANSVAHRTSRKLNIWIFGVMALAIVLLLTNTFILHRGVDQEATVRASTAPPNSIAVLPFINMSSDKQQDYFADGIAEDLLNLLTGVQPLRVAARTSSFAFKGKGLGIPEIAARLHVANVLEGSVRKAGDKVRVTAQLVRAADGYQIWSQRYDRKLTDIFEIQDVIAADVVKNLKIKLLGALPTARPTDPKAYALYLQARQLSRQNSAEFWRAADALYHKVLTIDPRYAPAWVGQAINLENETKGGLLPRDQGLQQAREAVDKALAIDPNYAPAHAELGSLAIDRNELSVAARHFQRALALDSSDVVVLNSSAILLQALGRLQPAIAVNEYLVARDPVNPVWLNNLGLVYIYAGRYDEAITRFRTVLSLSPGFSNAGTNLGTAFLLRGNATAALTQFRQVKDEFWRQYYLAQVYHALGQKAQSDAALATLVASHSKDGSYQIAQIYAFRGESTEALAWFAKAVQYADPGLFGIVTDPWLARIRTDPRWLPFLHNLDRSPEQLARIKFKVTLPGASGPVSGTPAVAVSQVQASTAAAPAGSPP